MKRILGVHSFFLIFWLGELADFFHRNSAGTAEAVVLSCRQICKMCTLEI